MTRDPVKLPSCSGVDDRAVGWRSGMRTPTSDAAMTVGLRSRACRGTPNQAWRTAAVVAAFLLARTLCAQVELVRGDFFPAEFEFKELVALRSDEVVTEIGKVAGQPLARYLSVLGFRRLASRSYQVVDGTFLDIEVATLADGRAAYSLLTLARTGPVESGPLGDGFVPEASGLSFSQGSRWVRIAGSADPVLMQRVAQSVSNRIGGQRGAPPTLISKLPSPGRDAGSLRYLVGAPAFARFGGSPGISRLPLAPDVEVAECSYGTGEKTGNLTLLSFPTSQVAEEFLDRYSREPAARGTQHQVFTRRSGPLVGILVGGLSAREADSLLGSIRYTYAVKWIYDRRNQTGAVLWGVPVALLGTVVRSLALTALLCILSILGGVAFAAFRIYLRARSPNNIFDNPERTELIRLKLDEK